ncbi:hypothetical protein BFJ67_g18063 [Fusarium oxysporum f. sp. cepae]|nr:hypothetical protein BFJ67_g18063 [Fusarium oxysporum f. sp. cepae]
MMSSSESSGTSTDSDYAEASRTLGKCSSQPLSSTISQAMSDAFVALDDITVDLKPIALRDSAQGIPRAFDIWKFSLDSLSVHKSVSSYSKLSDATSKQCTYSPSFVPESKERQGTVTTENDDHVSVFKHERLQQKSNGWLSQLPDLPGAELRPCTTTPRDPSRQERLPEHHETWDNKESPLLESLESKNSCITWISSATAIVVIMLQER